MHGLINRSFQNYMSDSYGREAWFDVAARAGVIAAGIRGDADL